MVTTLPNLQQLVRDVEKGGEEARLLMRQVHAESSAKEAADAAAAAAKAKEASDEEERVQMALKVRFFFSHPETYTGRQIS